MNPLQLWILAILSTQGPLREIDMLKLSPERSIETITKACLSLQSDGLIELPRGTRPVSFSWQLTPARPAEDRRCEKTGGVQLTLNDIQQAMKPALQAGLAKMIPYSEMTRLCQLAYYAEALEQADGVQSIAARRLGITESMAFKIARGEALGGRAGSKKKKPAEQK